MADTKRNVLITAAGGNIGTELIPRLLDDPKYHLVFPTSNAERLLSKLPSTRNVSVEHGDIQDPHWVESLLREHSVDTVFLCLMQEDEFLTTLNFLNAMERAGTVKYLVYLSICGDMVSPEGVETTMKLNSDVTAAHMVVKTTMEQKLRYSDYPWQTTVLGPTLFFSNDLRCKNALLGEGLFDQPLGEKGVSRVATSDIALAIHNLLDTFPKYAGKKIQLGSLRLYTGAEIANLWSQALGKQIKMIAVEEFEQDFLAKVGGSKAWARDLTLMYETFAGSGWTMSEEDYKLQVEVLGKEAEDYEAWVRKVGTEWMSS